MKNSRRVYTLAILSAAALLCGTALPSSAMWSSNGAWVRTRQDDELIAIALASKDPSIGVVYLMKNQADLESQKEKVTTLKGAVKHVDPAIDYIRAVVPIDAVQRAMDVPSGDVASIDLDMSYHNAWQPPGGDWVEPPTAAETRRYQTEINSPETRAFMRTPSPIAHDLGADVWRHEHPTFDGRGILIADVENLIDPMVPQLSGALSLDGKPVRKVEGLHILVDPGDHEKTNDNAAQWLDMRASVSGADTVAFNSHTYRLPHPGQFRIGLFDLKKVAKGTYWLNPKVLQPFIGDGIFAVLWEPSSGKAWVDARRSHDFRTARAMRDYNIAGDWGYFGSMDVGRYPLITPAVSFVVLQSQDRGTIGIGLTYGEHAVGVTTSAAGNPQSSADPVHGVAPAAQVASFEYSGFKLHSQAEALIAAAEDPKVDVIIYEWHSGIHTTSEEGWFIGALNERLVQRFDKPIFVPGDNQAALDSIDDGGIGPDVIAVSGSQSAESYWHYDGFRPSVPMHKHWGGLTDGPGQDGRLKPDLLAPSGYVAGHQKWLYSRDDTRAPGLYTLPPGFIRFGGTSQATPTAAGAAALLMSGAKQSGMHVHAPQLADAMRLGARLSPYLMVHEQGNGLIDVAASWKILAAQAGAPASRSLARVCGGSVNTARWPHGAPNGGMGIFETIGWHPGSSGDRTMRFCLAAPPLGNLSASLLRNDGTFSHARAQTSGSSAEISLSIQPRLAGFHSVLVELHDSKGHVVGRGMATVAASAQLNAAHHYKSSQKIVVPRPGYTTTFVDVPPETDALIVQANGSEPFALALQDPSGTSYQYAPYGNGTNHSLTIPSPMSGAWEILLEDDHDIYNVTRSLSPLEPKSVEVTAQVVRAGATSDGKGKSEFADVPVHRVGSAAQVLEQTAQFSTPGPVLIPIDVPSDITALFVDLSGSDPQVDAYLIACHNSVCAPKDRLLGSAIDKRFTIPDPEAGRYYVALDDFSPLATTSLPTYKVSVFAYNRFDASGKPSPESTSTGGTASAYEVNCEPGGTEVVASPKCGLFLVRDK